MSDSAWEAARLLLANPDKPDCVIAREAGLTPGRLSQLRKDAHFREALEWVRAELQSKLRTVTEPAWETALQILTLKSAERMKNLRSEFKSKQSKTDTRIDYIFWHMKTNWTGSVESPFDGTIFTNLHAYIQHLRDWREPDGTRPVFMLPKETDRERRALAALLQRNDAARRIAAARRVAKERKLLRPKAK